MKWQQDYVALAAAQRRVVAGFNVFGYEDAQAVIRAAARVDAPVLLMVNRDARKEMDIAHWGALLGSLAEQAAIPVGVHLDHCEEPALIERAMCSGFTSVMYDGSKTPFADNLQISRALGRLAHQNGVFLETELGAVPYSDIGETEIHLTSPVEAQQMQRETETNWLAVSVGNIHRLTARKAQIAFSVLQKLEQGCTLPLVIHGASGLTDQDALRLKAARIGKMNYGTVLRQAFGNALRAEINAHPLEFDRLKLFAGPVAQVEEQAFQVIQMLWRKE